MVNKMDMETTITMLDGNSIPLFGFGTFMLAPGAETKSSVLHALETGYRHIDTATVYQNEESVGKAIQDSGISREEIFLTTKVANDDHGYDATLAACNDSLKRLGVSYVDLYLMHWPTGGLWEETWKAMEHLVEEGKSRSIGVSNFFVSHLDAFLPKIDSIPVINQVEFSPYLYRKGLQEYCKTKKIRLGSYSPLTRGTRLEDSTLQEIATNHKKSSAQILLRWQLEKNIVLIPKSSQKQHVVENSAVFDFSLSKKDNVALDSMNENLRTGWYPEDFPEEE